MCMHVTYLSMLKLIVTVFELTQLVDANMFVLYYYCYFVFFSNAVPGYFCSSRYIGTTLSEFICHLSYLDCLC